MTKEIGNALHLSFLSGADRNKKKNLAFENELLRKDSRQVVFSKKLEFLIWAQKEWVYLSSALLRALLMMSTCGNLRYG